jgi:hypothetical protein
VRGRTLWPAFGRHRACVVSFPGSALLTYGGLVEKVVAQ